MKGFTLSEYVKNLSNESGVSLTDDQINDICHKLIKGKNYPAFIAETEDMIFDTVGVKVSR